jgi:hypothetical protein
MARDEIRHVVIPCLKLLNALNYLVITDQGKRRFGFIEALAITRSSPATRGVVWRQNVGVARYKGEFEHASGRFAHLKIEERFVRYGVTGLSDINGMVNDGRILAIECKEPGYRPSPEQAAYLEIVKRFGGIALCVHSADELLAQRAQLM